MPRKNRTSTDWGEPTKRKKRSPSEPNPDPRQQSFASVFAKDLVVEALVEVEVEPEQLQMALAKRKNELVERLTTGAARIEEARQREGDSEKILRWEFFWLKLLKKYEQVCNQEQRQGKGTDIKQAS
jgi:hypothetical protein